jgi:hypothetical protein
MRYWFSELLQKKQRSPFSRVLKVKHHAKDCMIHSTYTMLLHRPHPLEGQHPVIYHEVFCETLSQMAPYQKSYAKHLQAKDTIERQLGEMRDLGMLTR